MKLKQIIEFLSGFAGPIFLIWLVFWFPKIDFDITMEIFLIAIGVIFFIYFFALMAKNTEKIYAIFNPQLKTDAYFVKGLIIFSILAFVISIILGFYYSIIPTILWILLNK